jgi:hypothetical protein
MADPLLLFYKNSWVTLSFLCRNSQLPRPSLLGLLSFTHLRDSALTAFKARPNRSVKPTQNRKKEPAGKTPVKCTANEGPVRIQYKCLVSNYVFLNEGIIMFCLLIPTLIYL